MRYRKGLEASFRTIDMIYIKARQTKDVEEQHKLLTIAQLMIAELRR